MNHFKSGRTFGSIFAGGNVSTKSVEDCLKFIVTWFKEGLITSV
jgi:hypothetical protein